MATTTTRRTPTNATTMLRLVQVFAVLSVLNLVLQFVTAGELFGREEGPEGLHSAGAIALHVFTGLLTIAAGLYWNATRGPIWPTILAAVTFVLSFVQAYFGGRSTLYIHIPGSLVLTVGAVWVLAWSFSASARVRA